MSGACMDGMQTVVLLAAGTEYDSVQNDFQEHATGERPAITTIGNIVIFVSSVTEKLTC